MSQSTHELAEAVRRYRTRLAAVAATALAAAAALGLAGGRWATRPIRRLQQAAAALGAGELDARAPADHGPPEVRDLARRFNTMAEDLERLVTASTEFAADVSHQLRTPLTAARLHLGTLDRAHAEDRSALDRLEGDLDRIQRTIDGLLALTRIERTLPRLQRVDLAEAIDQRRQTWAATAEDAAIELLAEASPGDSGTFDPQHLEQVLDNLIDNALAFAPRGTRITLRVTNAPDHVELHVTDHGPGIPAERRTLATERHWHDRSGGSGLGLAICARLCRHNTADLRLDETPGGGLDAVISMRPGHPDRAQG